MSKAEELVKVCELLTHWGCEESMARQAAIQIVSGHPCDINDVFLSDNLVEQSEVITSFVGDYGPELLCTETLVDPMRYQRTLDAICKNTSALCKHFGAEPTKSPSDEGRED